MASGLTLRDVPGIRIGHATDGEGLTGCTVVLCTAGAVAGVDVRGSAPGTLGTDALRPTGVVERIHAVCLAGGSAFGMAAVSGVMRWLAEREIGFPTGIRPVPIVPAAIIFDLGVGSPTAIPTPEMGYAACEAAERGDEPLEGRIGAGTGATVGKLGGQDGVPGGVGSAAVQVPAGWLVGALAVVNAVGNVVGRDGRLLAGNEVLDPGRSSDVGFGNTTLAVVATNAPLDRAECRKMAELGHDALALAISPVHTLFDGDTVFALSTAAPGATGLSVPDRVSLGMTAVEVLRRAIERAVPR